MTHYERLGVAPTASAGEIRSAYRRAARANHPDTHGERASARMAEINRAWAVLRDPGRRCEYDLALRAVGAGGPSRPAPTTGHPFTTTFVTTMPSEPAHNPFARYQDPPRFPWRLMAVMAAVGIAVIIVGLIIAKPSTPPPPDNVLTPGSCVTVLRNADVGEVNCTDSHDGVVRVLVDFGARCPDASEPHRDRQGMGTACVDRSPGS